MLQLLICVYAVQCGRGAGVRCTGGKAAARAGACHGTSGREDTSPGAAVQGHPVNTDTSIYRVIL